MLIKSRSKWASSEMVSLFVLSYRSWAMTSIRVLSTESWWTGSGHGCLWRLSMTPARASALFLLRHCWTMNIPHYSGALCTGSMSKPGIPKGRMARKTSIPLSSSNFSGVCACKWAKADRSKVFWTSVILQEVRPTHSAREVAGFELSAFVFIEWVFLTSLWKLLHCLVFRRGQGACRDVWILFSAFFYLSFATTDATGSESKLYATV